MVSTSDEPQPAVPIGLTLGRVDASLAAAVLEEVLHHLEPERPDLASVMFEVGWSYLLTTRAGAMCRAAPLAEYPRLRTLLGEAMAELGVDCHRVDESRLNVICRRYLPGQGLTPHRDLPEMFEENVYGCVLENTSDSALEFSRTPDSAGALSNSGRYTVDERPGTCFRQCGEARFDWVHGINKITRGERFSVTWRWIRADSLWFQSMASADSAK